MRTLLLSLTLFAATADADPARLTAREATYDLSSGILTLGEARFSLAPQDVANCYRYEYTATPRGMARMFVGEIREISEFCVTDAGLRSHRYEFRRADKPEKDYLLEFDWSKHKVFGGRAKEQSIPDGALDRLAIQQAVRLWAIAHAKEEKPAPVEFTMADSKRVVTYRFAITGRETVEVPAGKFDALVVQRVDDPKKTMRYWLAPERDYMPVKVQHIDDDDPELRMVMK